MRQVVLLKVYHTVLSGDWDLRPKIDLWLVESQKRGSAICLVISCSRKVTPPSGLALKFGLAVMSYWALLSPGRWNHLFFLFTQINVTIFKFLDEYTKQHFLNELCSWH